MSASGFSDPEHGKQELNENNQLDICRVREWLKVRGEMAVVSLICASLKHAADVLTHPDVKILSIFRKVRDIDKQQLLEFREQACHLAREVQNWMRENILKTLFLFIGLGGTVYKAKTIANIMQGMAKGFITWGNTTTAPLRFLGFVGLMMIRLVISTLVPPTSPGFGIILEAATPESEKWTAMPFFLAASTIAGAMPYGIDKILHIFWGKDFLYTKFLKSFVDQWPLTCWTGPTMRKVFESVGGGKTGASVAVIFAHAAPFMGAQTTNMQRYFLPHPLDTIISQPFGMSEDLLGMALAEATSNPRLASMSITFLIAGFNLLYFAVFSKCKEFKAFVGALLNFGIGAMMVLLCFAPAKNGSESSLHEGLLMVAVQLLTQLFVVPTFLSVAKLIACRTAYIFGCTSTKPLLPKPSCEEPLLQPDPSKQTSVKQLAGTAAETNDFVQPTVRIPHRGSPAGHVHGAGAQQMIQVENIDPAVGVSKGGRQAVDMDRFLGTKNVRKEPSRDVSTNEQITLSDCYSLFGSCSCPRRYWEESHHGATQVSTT